MTTVADECCWEELFELVELSVEHEAHAPFADSDDVVFERWEQPSLPLDLEMQHLLRDFAHDLLPDPAGEASDRATTARIRRLPTPLRSLLGKLKDQGHRLALLDSIDAEVRRHVGVENTRHVDVPGEIFKASYLLEVHRSAALNLVAKDSGFVATLREELNRVKQDGHLVNTYGGAPPLIPEFPAYSIPSVGPWRAESWLGLSTSSLPESLPEEVVVALAQRAWRNFGKWGRRRHPVGRVLHWGALNGTFALALKAAAPKGLTLVIDEIDSVGQEQSRSWSGRRSSRLLETQRDYDLLVVHVPPPGDGANQIRNRYKDLARLPGRDRQLDDLGRRGPRKWRLALRRLLVDLLPRLKTDAEVYLVLPSAVRVAPPVCGYPQWGYEPSPQLSEGVVEQLVEGGLTRLVDLEIDEVNVLEQPFFRDRRCPWRLTILGRGTAPCHQHDDGDDLFVGDEATLG
jgi:hypothetical protein